MALLIGSICVSLGIAAGLLCKTAGARTAAPTAPSKALSKPVSTSTNSHQPLRLRFVGDIVLGRYGVDGFRKFAAIAPKLDGLSEWLEGDLVLANLETPVASTLPVKGPRGPGSYFGADPEMLKPIARLGFTHLGLANNHAEDLGAEGLLETSVHVKGVGLVPIGSARVEAPQVRFERLLLRGRAIQLVAITTIMNFEHSEYQARVPYVPLQALAPTLTPLIREIPRNELAIVFVHWGQEDDPSPGGLQREVAHELVDAGADLVIGHHPHVLQAIETYSGSLIAYSLGNFLFDSYAAKRRIGAILAVDFEDPGFCTARVSFIPTHSTISPSYKPRLADRFTAQHALAAIRLRQTLAMERPDWKREGNRFVSELRRNSSPCSTRSE